MNRAKSKPSPSMREGLGRGGMPGKARYCLAMSSLSPLLAAIRGHWHCAICQPRPHTSRNAQDNEFIAYPPEIFSALSFI
jgi:hypothetical protein